MAYKKKKLTVLVGEEFASVKVDAGHEAQASAEQIKAVSLAKDTDTRTRISYVFVGVIVLFVFGSAILGLYEGNFDNLSAVWGVVGPLTGAIVGYYYRVPGG